MAATDFETLGELEDEFEEEAAQLRPLFSRGATLPPGSPFGRFAALDLEAPIAPRLPPRARPIPLPECPPRVTHVDCPRPGIRANVILDHFDFDRAIVKPGCHTLLVKDIARRITQSQSSTRPICSVLIVGHTDPVGSDAYNLQLGKRRAAAVADALCKRLRSLRPKLACSIKFKLATCGERRPKGIPGLDRRVEVFFPAPPAPKGCPPFKNRVRLHLKILTLPKRFSIETMLANMRRVYEPAGLLIEVVSCERLHRPSLDDLDIFCPAHVNQLCCPFPCATNNLNAEHVDLFRNRHNALADEIVIYFVRSTNPGLNGCCAHPPGRPGVVVASQASRWTMAHETAHVLGVPHVAGEPCASPLFVPTRLMTACGTDGLRNVPTLVPAEVMTMTGSNVALPC
jgi:outer membrane protein OmpA-like peptidoglycan-associated protein